MRGLKDLADACIFIAKESSTSHRFISPGMNRIYIHNLSLDNSFGTWWNIIERPVKNDSFRREIYVIGTKPGTYPSFYISNYPKESKLHVSPQDVKEFYAKHAPTTNESWYITPVGNPSGGCCLCEDIHTSRNKGIQ